MDIAASFSRLSTKEKVAAVVVLGATAFVAYELLKPGVANADENTPSLPPNPQTQAPKLPIGIDPNAKGAATYTVNTMTDPLLVRQGPGQNYDQVGYIPKGGSVLTTGQTANGTADGQATIWMAVFKPNSNEPWGWMAKKYLVLSGAAV